MKPVAWYDPSNGVVSTDKNSPLFTPLGQVWPLFSQRPWVGLTNEQFQAIKDSLFRQQGWDGEGWDLALKEAIEAKLRSKNT